MTGIKRLILCTKLIPTPMEDGTYDYDDPIERRKWLSRLMASAKRHERKELPSLSL